MTNYNNFIESDCRTAGTVNDYKRKSNLFASSVKLNHRPHVVTLVNLPMSKDIQKEIERELSELNAARQRNKRQAWAAKRRSKNN